MLLLNNNTSCIVVLGGVYALSLSLLIVTRLLCALRMSEPPISFARRVWDDASNHQPTPPLTWSA
jgi:hypothetical protein